jgi:hypothetical protein
MDVIGESRRARYVKPDAASRRDLVARARAVLDGNWTGSSTVPSRGLYPHQWSWDSAFISIGRSHYDQARAQEELESLFRAQWATGMVPHIVFNPEVPTDAYFPGPAFWQSERSAAAPVGVQTSGITQPAVHARAALAVWRNATDTGEARAFLERLYPKLVAQHRYLAEERDVAGDGLAVIMHPWESGADNSPAWDQALEELVIPPGSLPAYQRRDLVHADPADRPSDQAYDGFVYLAMIYRDHGYDDKVLCDTSPFLVEPPMFNTLRLWSSLALAEIARVVGDDPAPHEAAAVRIHDALLRRLNSRRTGRFGSLNVRKGTIFGEGTIGSAMPLLDPDLPAEPVAAIQAFLSRLSGGRSRGAAQPDPIRYFVPSYDPAEGGYDPRRYWRGAVWVNTNWLIWHGLRQHYLYASAIAVAGSTVALIQRSGFREYFDPCTGVGYGSHDFSWTAALLIDLLAAGEPVS